MAIHGRTSYPHHLPRISYAQNHEDILIDRLFRGEVGTYMDIGACHPVLDSNTWFFYERGWRGVNFEPSASSFRLFLEKRPEDLNLNLAASDSDGELTFYEVDDHDINGTSTLSAEIARGYSRRGLEVSETKVPVRTVRGLVEENNIDPPDFLSIDVESFEYQVIQGIDLENWRPKLIVVESTLPGSTEPNYQSWEPTLLGHGYRFMAFNGLNRFYLRDDLEPLARHFETPVNVFDGYRPYAQVRAEAATEELRGELDLEREHRERVQRELRTERLRLQRLRTAHCELSRRESILQHQARYLEGQRDELGAQLDHLMDELNALRSGLSPVRPPLDGQRARIIAASA
jgi:FkbM family methyltransferase